MSLFKRLLKSKSGSKRPSDSSQSKYYPEKSLPIDERFTYNFKKNGGKFLYCENFEETLEAFDSILLENDWYEKDVFCINENLSSRFEGFNLNYTNNTNAAFFISTCESLISSNGSILISSNQIKEKRLAELPFNIIIYCTTSQLVETISEGLRTIKNKHKGRIPSNITTIKDFETKKEKDFMSYGSTSKNLYLLLQEDL